MDFHQILVFIFATTIIYLAAILTDGIFIRKTKNKRPYLTWLGIAIFGKNKGASSEFIGAKKAVLIRIVDLIFGTISGAIMYKISIILIEKTFVFYIPLSIISINSLYLAIRKSYDKVKWQEWLVIVLLYALSITLIVLTIKYRLFGYS